MILGVLCWLVAALADPTRYISSDGVIYADNNIITEVIGKPHNYTVAMLMTAENPQFGCGFCDVLGPSFRFVAQNWARDHPDGDGLYFVVADVDNTRDTFKVLGLSTVPNVVLYWPHPKGGLNRKHEFISFYSMDDPTDYLAAVMQNQGFNIKIVRPFRWDKFFKFVATAAAVLGGGYRFRTQVLRLVRAKKVYVALSMVILVFLMGGHMFNFVRQPRTMGRDDNGIILFEPGFGSQFQSETQVIAALYAALAFAVISLFTKVPALEGRYAQNVGAVVASAAVLILYSVLLETFKIKFGGYPFRLLPIAPIR